jgi:hypothetical protein
MAASFACALGARGTASLGTWGRPVRGSALAKPGAKRAASRAGGRRWCRKAPNGTPSRGRGKRPMPPWAPQGGEEPEAAAIPPTVGTRGEPAPGRRGGPGGGACPTDRGAAPASWLGYRCGPAERTGAQGGLSGHAASPPHRRRHAGARRPADVAGAPLGGGTDTGVALQSLLVGYEPKAVNG